MIFKHLTTVFGEYIFISGTLVTVNKGLAARYMIVDFLMIQRFWNFIHMLKTGGRNWLRSVPNATAVPESNLDHQISFIS